MSNVHHKHSTAGLKSNPLLVDSERMSAVDVDVPLAKRRKIDDMAVTYTGGHRDTLQEMGLDPPVPHTQRDTAEDAMSVCTSEFATSGEVDNYVEETFEDFFTSGCHDNSQFDGPSPSMDFWNDYSLFAIDGVDSEMFQNSMDVGATLSYSDSGRSEFSLNLSLRR